MSYLKIILRAEKQELNINRVYEVHLNKGLFDSWVVITAFGRYGYGAQQRIYSFFVLDEAKEFIRMIMKKRFNAEKRVGCNYKIIKRSSSADFNNLY